MEGRAPAPLLTGTKNMEMHPVYLWLDSYLIWFYRLTGSARGEFSPGHPGGWPFSPCWWGSSPPSWRRFMVRRRFEQVAGEAKKYQDLSMEALKSGDRPAYEAANTGGQ